MADQIVITEKTSQAKDVRAAVGSRYGDILAAEGHLFDLVEPEDVVPAWKRWSPILLRPEGLYGTRPAVVGGLAFKGPQEGGDGVFDGSSDPSLMIGVRFEAQQIAELNVAAYQRDELLGSESGICKGQGARCNRAL